MVMSKVSLFACGSYDISLLDSVIERQFQSIDPGGNVIKPGDNVVIKPNLVISKGPEEAATTHPEYVAAIVRAVKRRGGVPEIAESPMGPYNPVALRGFYARCGMEHIAKREGAALNYDTGSTEVSCGGLACRTFTMIDPVLKADVVISAAKLKTHEMMTYSGAVKNLFGVVPGLAKPEMHYRFPEKRAFAQMIVDICERVKPAMSFIDAVDCMEGNGPTGGDCRHMGVSVASLSPYCADLLAAYLAGFGAGEVPVLTAAARMGLCPDDALALEIDGNSPQEFRTELKKPEAASVDIADMLPPFVREIVGGLLTARPEIDAEKCVGCGRCAENCPQKTIEIIGGRAKIDRSRCIRCFCCHEACPQRAVKIKKSLAGRF
jgi:uncharacterized protein (DUF362 family)/Pyruvate/2-oxoacid:ferredoxin oxidoreductase delta subunit